MMMKNVLYLLSLLTCFACSVRKKSDPATGIDSTRPPATTNLTTPPKAMPEQSAPTSGSSVQANAWRYEKTVDTEGQPIYKASITSPTRLVFSFPYSGGSTATLTLRKRQSGTHVYIQVSNGQFNRSFQGGQARIRFDGGQPVTYAVSAAENGSANVIFFDSEPALIQKMKRTRTMLVDIEFAGQGKRQIEFRTAGLRWTH